MENLSLWTCVAENSMSERLSLSVFNLLELEMEEMLFCFFTAEGILYWIFSLDSFSRAVVSNLKNIDYIKVRKWHPIKTVCRSLTWNLRIFLKNVLFVLWLLKIQTIARNKTEFSIKQFSKGELSNLVKRF